MSSVKDDLNLTDTVLVPWWAAVSVVTAMALMAVILIASMFWMENELDRQVVEAQAPPSSTIAIPQIPPTLAPPGPTPTRAPPPPTTVRQETPSLSTVAGPAPTIVLAPAVDGGSPIPVTIHPVQIDGLPGGHCESRVLTVLTPNGAATILACQFVD